MKKKLISAVLILTLALSLSAPALAATFEDLNGHWAREYMEDLYARGYLTGYENNTMRPENNITVCESLVFLSRLYNPDDEALQSIYKDYGAVVESTAGSGLSWAYKPLAICLAAGIVTQPEFKALNLSVEIEKELLAVFLVRAMQMEEMALTLDPGELSFGDTETITENYRGHVVALIKAGIVEGDENNNFTPKLSVTRAVVATMISRALEYIVDSGIKLVIDKYEGITRSSGILTSIGSGTFRLYGEDGLVREFTVSTSTKVTVNYVERSLTSTYVGSFANITENDGVLSAVSIDYNEDVKWVQGTLNATSSTSGSSAKRYIYVSDIPAGSRTQYTFGTNYDIYRNGTAITFTQLTKGDFVLVKLEDGNVTEVRASSADLEVNGSITSISYGATVTMKIIDSSGRTLVFLLNMLDMPAIYRGDIAISIDRLTIGDEIAVAVENGEVNKISTAANEVTLKGVITSVITSSSGTSWVIRKDDGESATYMLDSAAIAYSGTKAIDISVIGVGDEVSVVVYSGVITEVYLESPYSSTTKINATVLVVDTSAKTITALCGEKLVYINCSGLSYIINASTGANVKLSSLENGASLVVYGSYTSTSNFSATSIIIEA